MIIWIKEVLPPLTPTITETTEVLHNSGTKYDFAYQVSEYGDSSKEVI